MIWRTGLSLGGPEASPVAWNAVIEWEKIYCNFDQKHDFSIFCRQTKTWVWIPGNQNPDSRKSRNWILARTQWVTMQPPSWSKKKYIAILIKNKIFQFFVIKNLDLDPRNQDPDFTKKSKSETGSSSPNIISMQPQHWFASSGSLWISVADPDPGCGAFLIRWSGIQNVKKSGSGMIIPDHFPESLETVFSSFCVKNA